MHRGTRGIHFDISYCRFQNEAEAYYGKLRFLVYMSSMLGNMPIVHKPHSTAVLVWMSAFYCIFIMVAGHVLLALSIWNTTISTGSTEWSVVVLRIAGCLQLVITVATHIHIFIYGFRRNGLNTLLKSIRHIQTCNLPRPPRETGNKITIINIGTVIFSCIFTVQYVLYGVEGLPMAEFYRQFQYAYTSSGFSYIITFFATSPVCLALYTGYITTVGIFLLTLILITDEMELFACNFKDASRSRFEKISLSELANIYDALTDVCDLVSSLWSPWYSFCTCIMVPSICFIGYNAVFPFDAMSIFYAGLFCAFLATISLISSFLDTAVSMCRTYCWKF